MRRFFFRKLLNLFEHRRCGLIIRIELQMLANLTGQAFGKTPVRVFHRSPKRALREYADFTLLCMDGRVPDPGQLYSCAYKLGRRIRRITGFRNSPELSRLVFYLYRNINIYMTGSLPGRVEVSDCYFSRIYTPEQCLIMSEIDSGIISGICRGGRLVFARRLTEGCSCCTAELTGRDNR